MKYIDDYEVHTADDEEPNCIRCANQDSCNDGKFCGPKYGWRLYERRVKGDNNNEQY
nr:MAG TPA: hypothetical protein [Bacteriophage sp.]